MVIIIDKSTKAIKQNMGTNSVFPGGNIPNVTCAEDEEIVRIHDNSELAKKIMAEKRSFKFNSDCSDIEYTDTDEEYQTKVDEKNKAKEKQQILTELASLDAQVPRIIEDMLEHLAFKGFLPHQNSLDVILRKQTLRAKFKELKTKKMIDRLK